ncbi:MAG: beta-ketoacyl-ACP synthase 3, partial [Gammaproteobacteria bacterium]|nr:beta-ketoacyl-ACP synthase 3 [Gammaproteobacteria bacterium]
SERTGIRERRISHVSTTDLGVVAAQHALAAAGLEPNAIDMIVFASASPDVLVPNTASRLQAAIGNGHAAAFDLNSGCTGFIYGLKIAADHVNCNPDSVALVVGAERLTWYLDWTQRDSAVLFGDGAGAAVVQHSDDNCGVLGSRLGCEAAAGEALMIPDFGTVMDRFGDDPTYFTLQFDGREIFRHAVRGMAEACARVLDETGLTAEDVDLVIPHQANVRIIDALADKLGVPREKVVVNIEHYGNTSSATIPIALTDALAQGRVKPGAIILMPAFGAGLTWGATVMRWGERTTPVGASDATLAPCESTGLQLIEKAVAFFRSHNQSAV